MSAMNPQPRFTSITVTVELRNAIAALMQPGDETLEDVLRRDRGMSPRPARAIRRAARVLNPDVQRSK